ncbi:DUF7064 domain-containing protein [Patulibacter medicamentivorans]|nr:hypothetical protein [Patulibacter medicamentivorans]
MRTQAPETDLLIPLPADGETWDPHTVHTHFLGFSVPEAQIGAVVYFRYQPAFPLLGGGVGIYQGTSNVRPLDVEHLNWWNTMPYSQFEDGRLSAANGLTLEVVVPGEELRVRYESRDGRTSFDVTQLGVSPLVARGSLMPALEGGTDPAQLPGGSEQFMHVTGRLTLNGEHHDVDCVSIRDRSWRQLRPEGQGFVDMPPLGWTPLHFGDDLALNAFSFEPPHTDPAWAGLFDVPVDGPFHQGHPYVIRNGEISPIARVERNVLEYHPQTFQAVRQELLTVEEDGRELRFEGRAVASASLPMWHNIAFVDSVFRWQDELGRVAHNSYQECWFDTYQREIKKRADRRVGA